MTCPEWVTSTARTGLCTKVVGITSQVILCDRAATGQTLDGKPACQAHLDQYVADQTEAMTGQ